VGSGHGEVSCEMGVSVQNSVKGVWEFDVPASPCELDGLGGTIEGVGGGSMARGTKAALRATSTTSDLSPR
jgi:hypothetical protein